MAEFDNKTDTSSNSGGATDSTGGGGDASSGATGNNDELINPTEAPLVTGATATSGNGEAEQSEALGRSLGELSTETSLEKTPEQLRQEEIHRKIDEAVVRYQLNDVEAKNLAVSLSQPGVEVTDGMVKKQVQAIAPVKLEIAEFKEKFAGSMVHVDNARRGELSSQPVGQSQERGVSFQMNA